MFRDLVDLLCWLVSFGVECNLFFDCEGKLLYRHSLRLAQEVWVWRELDVNRDGVQRAITPFGQRDAQRHDVVRRCCPSLGPVVHAERRERVIPLERDGERIPVLRAGSLLNRDDQFVEGLGGAAG